MGEQRRQYDLEFKRNAVELCRTSGKPVSQVANDLGINKYSAPRCQDRSLKKIS
jgi:transposase